jgi:hypothetical protein
MLRAIASSPHDLQPIFQSIIDSAVVCAGEKGAPSVLQRKQAFVSLRIHSAAAEQRSIHRQCFWSTTAF